MEWPADAYLHPGAPFLIGLYGLQSFDKQLDETVRGGRVAGRPIRILPVSKLADISQCQMLFISKSQVGAFYQIQPRLRGLNILTVSDAVNFCKWGGVIAFIPDSSRIRLQMATSPTTLILYRHHGINLQIKIFFEFYFVGKIGAFFNQRIF